MGVLRVIRWGLFFALIAGCGSTTRGDSADASADVRLVVDTSLEVDTPVADIPRVDAVDVVDALRLDTPVVDTPVVDMPVVDVVDVPALRDVPSSPDGATGDGPTSCGAFGGACCPDRTPVCDAGLSCVTGRCQCPAGSTRCGEVCVDLNTNTAHCGACGRVCPRRCTGGVCEPSTCGFVDCDGNPANGTETSTVSDVCNCGACGRRCIELPGVATASCAACMCTYTCHASARDCDGSAANGCEVRVLTDDANCGACGHACSAIQACRAGVCVDVPRRVDCGGRSVNAYNDVTHCGACGHACASGQVCDAGACVAACARSGTIRCGDETCVDPSTSGLHCGACGRACPVSQPCVAGSCAATCAAGLVVCAGTCVNLATDPSNCGSCGLTCPTGSVCTTGICQSTMCARRG